MTSILSLGLSFPKTPVSVSTLSLVYVPAVTYELESISIKVPPLASVLQEATPLTQSILIYHVRSKRDVIQTQLQLPELKATLKGSIYCDSHVSVSCDIYPNSLHHCF